MLPETLTLHKSTRFTLRPVPIYGPQGGPAIRHYWPAEMQQRVRRYLERGPGRLSALLDEFLGLLAPGVGLTHGDGDDDGGAVP